MLFVSSPFYHLPGAVRTNVVSSVSSSFIDGTFGVGAKNPDLFRLGSPPSTRNGGKDFQFWISRLESLGSKVSTWGISPTSQWDILGL